MLQRYRTVREAANQEIVIKRSRFIGYAQPVASEEEAVAFIEEIKRLHRTATHNCSAYMIGERDQFQKASDDGEPSGTAGKPILEVIKNKGLKNVAVVVTRYFGGIMLGAGGLVRAYTDGAVAGIEAAQEIEYVLHREVFIEVDYTWYGKLENELHSRNTRLGQVDFTDKVTVCTLPESDQADAFIAWAIDFTQGKATITAGKDRYFIDGE
ncbi:YigZ family protein [Paenibacillus endoradicis]|uniref:YigZ family protein n=1 Tax=Paenibacillus endoradicis TaxID=2972487 RepID=UPI00215938EC|nr:YigZ family protein [Paenibacillus endoradicis]MCR8657872.1 YigZ family protein [Paenibacillus endoradicis]